MALDELGTSVSITLFHETQERLVVPVRSVR